jgi:hypothetical protein
MRGLYEKLTIFKTVQKIVLQYYKEKGGVSTVEVNCSGTFVR